MDILELFQDVPIASSELVETVDSFEPDEPCKRPPPAEETHDGMARGRTKVQKMELDANMDDARPTTWAQCLRQAFQEHRQGRGQQSGPLLLNHHAQECPHTVWL